MRFRWILLPVMLAPVSYVVASQWCEEAYHFVILCEGCQSDIMPPCYCVIDTRGHCMGYEPRSVCKWGHVKKRYTQESTTVRIRLAPCYYTYQCLNQSGGTECDELSDCYWQQTGQSGNTKQYYVTQDVPHCEVHPDA